MTQLILWSIRIYLKTLALLAPKTAGRQAFHIFSTPRTRRSVPTSVEGVMARAEHFHLDVDGERVAAYRWAAAEVGGVAKPRVMLVHGWESRAARLAVWVEPLLAAGFEVVAFDAPAHGASTGRRAMPPSFVLAMVAMVQRVGPIHACVGHSLGGLSILLAIGAAELSGQPPLQVERLVILAGAESGVDAMGMFSEVLGLGDAFTPRILEAAAAEAGHAIADFDGHRVFADHDVPTLWFHDPEDTDVPIAAARRVAQACPHVALEVTEGLGHNDIARHPEIIRRGVEFLSR